MADECVTDVAVHHVDGSSAVPSASHGVRRTLPSGPNETTSTPRVESIVRSLCVRLGADLDVAAIAAEVEAEFSTYANARVTHFIPILVERRVWERLRPHVSA